MSDDPERRDPDQADDERDDLPSDPEAPGTYVDDENATDVAEPNEPA